MIGARGEVYPDKGTWQAAVRYRWQKSDRHFIGDDEQEERAAEGSQVINRIHLLDLGIRYNLSKRSAVGISVPYIMAERSMALRNAAREVVDRYQVQARGLSDVIATARRWMMGPEEHPDGNVALGVGIKLPTGENNVVDTRVRLAANGSKTYTVETVDQSIQPGDGGFGFLLEGEAFRRMGKNASLYLSGLYLFNPEGTSGVATYRGRASESIMSVADSYLLRGGAGFAPGIEGLGLAFGLRWEGVPAHDVFGSSQGFRRPGYAISLEPQADWTWRGNTFSLAVPFAVYRNRTVSVPDEEDGTHGDAAFADYLILLGWERTFK